MSIAFRVFVLLFFAYAGWETAGFQSEDLQGLGKTGVVSANQQ